MIREVLKLPNAILLQSSRIITLDPAGPDDIQMTPEGISEVIVDLIETAKNLPSKVVGLSAPQIGRPVCIFIALGEAFVNPVVVGRSGLHTSNIEGCHSLASPAIQHRVERWRFVDLEWIDGNLKPRKKRFRNFDARVIQHEYDHLLGILCNHPEPRAYLTPSQLSRKN